MVKAKQSDVGKLRLPWKITAKHVNGMQFSITCSEATFREIQRAAFGQDELPLGDVPAPE